MKRVMVIGARGSGKSTFAREIGARLGLPVVHLDRIFWLPGWTERPIDERRRLVALAEAEDTWVIDGNFTQTWPARVARADLVVWLDLPLPLRLWRVLRRWAVWHGRSRPDMQDGCPEKVSGEFLHYVVTTSRSYRRKCLILFAKLPAERAVHLRSARAVAHWLAGLA